MATLVDAVNGIIAASTQIHFTADQLDTLVKTFEGLREVVCTQKLPLTGQLTIPNDSQFWGKLCASFGVAGLEGLTLRLLSITSYDPMNNSIILGCLTALGEPLEAFLASRCDVEGKDNLDGDLYRSVLSVFYRVMEYDFTAAQVLEFVEQKPLLAVGALTATLQIATAPIEDRITKSNWQDDVALAVCVSKNLYQLSLQSTYFEGKLNGDTNSVAVSDLTSKFFGFVGQIVEGIVTSNLMETCVTILSNWQRYITSRWDSTALELLPSLEVFLCNIVGFVANVLSKTDDSATTLRRHVASETALVQSAVLPYLQLALEMMEKGLNARNLGRSIKTLVLLLKLMSFMTFKVKLFRPLLKATPQLVQRILTQPLLWGSPFQVEFIALCTRLSINAELEEGTAFLEHVMNTSLTPEVKAKLAWRLTSPQDDMYPINTLSDMYARLESLFDEGIAQVDLGGAYAGAYAVVGVRGEVAEQY